MIARCLNNFSQKRIIAISPLGIGNTILLIPTLRACKEFLTPSKMTVIVFTQQGKEILEHCPYVDNVVLLYSTFYKNIALVIKQIQLLYELRREHYDISLMAFPTNHILYNLISWIIHAKIRIAHEYSAKRKTNLSFLQNTKVVIKRIHDIEQNLELLSPFGIHFYKKGLSLELWIPEIYRNLADQFTVSYINQEGKYLIGIHAGSSQKRKMSYKRWPTEKFAILSEMIVERYPETIIFLFGGGEEELLNREIIQSIGSHAKIIQRNSIFDTAALIEKMSLFISNDSGLMHIAVSVGVPTIAIFGPTDAIRTAPYGNFHKVIRQDMKCSPCWTLERVGKRSRCPYNNPICLNELDVSVVFEAVNEKINANLSNLSDS